MNQSIRKLGVLFIVFPLLASLAGAAPPEQAKATKVRTVEGISEYHLENGLRFLLFPDPSSNKVTVNMTVLVGARHEGYGEAGMAHLLEHMLFKGCKFSADPKGDLEKRGAMKQGTTTMDRTNYYETMAASDENLEFAIRLEADRLVNSFIRHEDLATEMTLVRNEFEMNENDPKTILTERMMAAAYLWHNYGKTVLGNRSDIERVPIDRLQAFYRKYYRPDNVVLTVAGKFDQNKALELITRYFGALPRPTQLLPQTYTEEPPQDGERHVVLRRVGKVSVVGVVYHIPAAAHADFPALAILDDILTAEPSGRLYKALVEAKKATQLSGGPTARHDPGILMITAQVGDGCSPEEVRDIMLGILEKFQPATEQEVQRAQQGLKASIEDVMANSQLLASVLSEAIARGDWRLGFFNLERMTKVKPADVDRVARAYLLQSNRTVGTYIPVDKVARAPIPPSPVISELLKDYKGGNGVAQGENFDPTPENLEKRVKRFQLSSGVKVALLPKKTSGQKVIGNLTLHFGNDQSLLGHNRACGLLGPLMLRGGTKKHTFQEIDDRLKKLDAGVSVNSGTGDLSFAWEVKRANLPALLELVREIAREPAFPDKEFELLKRARKQGLEEALTDPESLALQSLGRKLSPYSKDDIRYSPTIAESLERLAKTTRDEVKAIYLQQVGAQVGELVLVGDFDPEAVVPQLEEIVAGWKSDVPYRRIPAQVHTVPASREEIRTPDKANAVYLAAHAFPMTDTSPDYPALLLGNHMLGGVRGGSRLWNRLREKEGISYEVISSFTANSEDPYAVFTIEATCNPANIDRADKSALEVLDRTLKEGFSEKELADAKKAILQQVQVLLGNDGFLAGALSSQLPLNRTFADAAENQKKIVALTAADVNRAMAKYLSRDKLVIVRAGDFKK
jgi:zinc protease